MTRVGAIDMGTNSTRLLIAEVTGHGRAATVQTLDRRMTITRLGQGVDADRRLHPDAIRRTLDALGEYGSALRAHEVDVVRAVATSAARDAANRDELFEPATELLGVRPELISGAEEAELSFLGATCELGTEGAPYLVVDIGGGSTEFVFGIDAPQRSISVDMGCVRLTEQFLASDPPAPEELSNAVGYVRDLLSDVEQAIPGVSAARTLVGLAGTVSTLASVELGLHEYDRDKIHGFRLGKDSVEDAFRTLATESRDERRHNPGLEPGRVDVIVGGAIVLVTILRTFGYDELLVSESDILDGIARSLPGS
jgi:exopolyphosphatase / guanosine-5'-triphosphate,3'-diphosphate pyrophosphatase